MLRRHKRAGRERADAAENRGERHEAACRHEVKPFRFLQENDAPAADGITGNAEADSCRREDPDIRVLDDHELRFARRDFLLFLFLDNFALELVCAREAVRFWTVTHEAVHDESEHDAGNARNEECGMPAERDDNHRSTEVRRALADGSRARGTPNRHSKGRGSH